MTDTVIRVEGLSKQYRIGARRKPYSTLRESIAAACRAPFRRWGGRRRPEPLFWALRDLSFEVRAGEVLGVIGRNGAGKSTLLKILSRITEPAEGMAEITGRVGSLLEVGTGFHNELSGRDNIYLNGAILGMKRTEIARKFDEIVAFAEVEEFVDTPVKHYSSGMYLRLAFAVAAHLEPEILLIDEVLAVGDAAFQKKCMGQMGKVAQQGRTVLFVSHNMAAVRALCTRVAYLEQGRLDFIGDPAQAIRRYNESATGSGQPALGSGDAVFTDVRINGSAYATIAPGEPFEASCRLHLRAALPAFNLICTIQDGGRVSRWWWWGSTTGSLPPRQAQAATTLPCGCLGCGCVRGVYGLFFKLLVSAVGTQTKFVSDNVMLDVLGEHTPYRCQLNPRVEWITRDSAVPAGR